ncbi:zinc transporter ZIP11-like isoform X5 [Cavia porcellus]|uniref:zinc transporter ZIP11-like isoform X5 n=1 Tax=Cavia porcellus TaxID=10141 RepID=UPI002FE3562E
MRMSEPHSVNDFGAISIMLQGHSTVFQALRGTFFTWGMTAAGAALVFVFSSGQRRILDGRLGFAAGGLNCGLRSCKGIYATELNPRPSSCFLLKDFLL